MNFDFITILLLSAFLYLFPSVLRAQTDNPGVLAGKDFSTLTEKFCGPDQVLFNGIYPEIDFTEGQGHPFFGENKFCRGTLRLQNGTYNDLYLRYNLAEQTLMITRSAEGEGSLQVVPPVDFIVEFTLNGKIFRKLDPGNGIKGFFQIVHDGRLKYICSYAKGKYRSYQGKQLTSGYSSEKRKSFLVVENQFSEITSLNSLLRCFPSEFRHPIRTYCQNEKIKLKKFSDSETVKLMMFCESLFPAGKWSDTVQTTASVR